jgi:hypothetical protein
VVYTALLAAGSGFPSWERRFSLKNRLTKRRDVDRRRSLEGADIEADVWDRWMS